MLCAILILEEKLSAHHSFSLTFPPWLSPFERRPIHS
jgi:hypothetical protein